MTLHHMEHPQTKLATLHCVMEWRTHYNSATGEHSIVAALAEHFPDSHLYHFLHISQQSQSRNNWHSNKNATATLTLSSAAAFLAFYCCPFALQFLQKTFCYGTSTLSASLLNHVLKITFCCGYYGSSSEDHNVQSVHMLSFLQRCESCEKAH